MLFLPFASTAIVQVPDAGKASLPLVVKVPCHTPSTKVVNDMVMETFSGLALLVATDLTTCKVLWLSFENPANNKTDVLSRRSSKVICFFILIYFKCDKIRHLLTETKHKIHNTIA
jgi:hypothetical protein